MGLLIVGGGPAGLAAARGYREAGGDGPVTMLTPEQHAPYTRPALSKDFLRGESEADDIALDADGLDLEMRFGTEATVLDPGQRTVTTAEETFAYDACVIATGAEPAPLPVPGIEHALLLRSLESARTLRERAERAHTAAVIGSGFIGCEVAASLAMRGLRVTLVSDEPVPHASRLGPEAGSRIAGWLTELGVGLQLGGACEGIEPGRVRVPGNPPVEAELIVVGGGIRPRARIADGLATDRGRIVTDEHMRTSAEGVYAAGDVALARNAAAGRPLPVEHWGEALNQGEAAGRNAAGEGAVWDAAPGFWSMIGDRTLKHVAWGDGFDEARFITHPGGAFTVWYGAEGITVGVLTHERDEDYERGRELIEAGKPLP
jgi:3-phenylpropionate/trans-cinnamate dioxygenase ferredoxin reductase subunit